MTKVMNFSECTKSVASKQMAVIKLPISNSHGIAVFADYLAEIQRQHDYEMHLKNAAFSFLVLKGLYLEFRTLLHTGEFRTDFQGRSDIASSYIKQESEVCNA